ncbi:YhcH/YjgK/YiaL family protein [uncultured Aquimarina sp.]|uniref:YhcH/YjgK/YiaL family protein n=1 Tax=uncultured Aquimarina sp. TaxID=575652 RepID=UPI002618DFDB|nr:YhcH/YjgK/YiaL family protein [uncultured Aquimarina sp.]
MILDTINNASFYEGISENIDKALQFLKSTNFETLETGRHEIDGERVFALVFDYETHEEYEDKWEAHRKYFDIQFVAKGIEKIALANILEMTSVTEYVQKDDYQLFKGDGGKFILRENDFIILGPNDVHQPAIHVKNKVGAVRKIVVKAMI